MSLLKVTLWAIVALQLYAVAMPMPRRQLAIDNAQYSPDWKPDVIAYLKSLARSAPSKTKPSVTEHLDDDFTKIIVPGVRANTQEFKDIESESRVQCCVTSPTGLATHRFTVSDSNDVKARGCLGNENVECSQQSSVKTSSANTNRRYKRQLRRQNEALYTIDNTPVQRAVSADKIEVKKDAEFDYDLVFDLDNGSVHQLRIVHPVAATNRQITDDSMGDSGPNWRSNMMRVWGRR